MNTLITASRPRVWLVAGIGSTPDPIDHPVVRDNRMITWHPDPAGRYHSVDGHHPATWTQPHSPFAPAAIPPAPPAAARRPPRAPRPALPPASAPPPALLPGSPRRRHRGGRGGPAIAGV